MKGGRLSAMVALDGRSESRICRMVFSEEWGYAFHFPDLIHDDELRTA
jgi:hypothetical protein